MSDQACERRDCGAPILARGLCSGHYDQIRKANFRLRHGTSGAMWPYHTSPYRPIAQSCERCGHLITALDIQRSAPKTKCPDCGPRKNRRETRDRYYQSHKTELIESSRVRALRANDQSRETASNSGKVWTGPELELAVDVTRTVPEVARLLGRTISAVAFARHRCRTDPAAARLAGDPRDD